MSPCAQPKVLLVDDSVVNQKIGLKQLERLGYTADLAGDAQAALQSCQGTTYDIVLLDCEMPVMNGIHAAQAMGFLPLPQRPRLIVGLLEPGEAVPQAALDQAYLHDYLHKPLHLDQLAAKFQAWGEVLAHTPNPGSCPIDQQHLHQVSDGDRSFELELLQIYLTDTKVHLRDLQRAIALQDYGAMEQAAHHIKGSSGNVGAIALQQVATTLEQNARNQNPKAADQLLQSLDSAYGELVIYVEQHYGGQPSTPNPEP